jgi:hypothetical protein
MWIKLDFVNPVTTIDLIVNIKALQHFMVGLSSATYTLTKDNVNDFVFKKTGIRDDSKQSNEYEMYDAKHGSLWGLTYLTDIDVHDHSTNIPDPKWGQQQVSFNYLGKTVVYNPSVTDDPALGTFEEDVELGICDCGKDKHGFANHADWCPKVKK